MLKPMVVVVSVLMFGVVACAPPPVLERETRRARQSEEGEEGEGEGEEGEVDCIACAANEVCVDGACVDIPASCPCPQETFCDLGTNTCRVGCLGDTDCASGRICEDRTCRAGCRVDNDCANDDICADNRCRAGCRADADCAANAFCDVDTCAVGCRDNDGCGVGTICNVNHDCAPGCDTDERCPNGEICDTGACRPGCRAQSDCGEAPPSASARVCDDTNTCVPYAESGRCLSDRECPTGEACDPNALRCAPVDGGGNCNNNCFHEGCSVGASCVVSHEGGGGRCHERDTGAPCGSNFTCGLWRECDEIDLVCENVRCGAGQGSCDEDMRCTFGSTCQNSTSGQGSFCFNGNLCSTDGDCAPGAVCQPGGFSGQTCTPFHACTAHEDCTSLYGCVAGECRPFHEIACVDDADCGAGGNGVWCDVGFGRCVR